MPQRHDQLARMVAVVARQSRADVVAQHIADLLGTALLVEKIIGQRSSGDLRNVLMLSDRKDFCLAQTTQRDAILERDHV